ncbi:MAG: hypothetical protein PHG03_05970 [Bacilli bacterium]|nr:hypothetical protein [Bacilli bacterium]MDD4796076.1 hypothetical protein [Bacilli bacterium]
MKKKQKNNYLNLMLILMGVMLLTLASSNIYKNSLENKINSSYISKYVANIQANEIKNASVEFSPDTFIYVSYTGDERIYNLEVKLRKILRENDLIDNFIFMDATDLMDEDNYLTTLNKSLSLKEKEIKKLPGIIYYKDNEIIDLIDSYNNLIDSGDFTQLLEKYEIVN